VRVSVLVAFSSPLNWVCAEDGISTGAVVVHVIVKVPSPLAVQLNSALLPLSVAMLCGGTVIIGGSTEWEGEGHVCEGYCRVEICLLQCLMLSNEVTWT